MLPTPRLLSAVLLAGVLVSGTAGARSAHSDETALTTATREWKALNANLKKRQHRDNWERVIGRLESIGHSKAPASVRSLALFRAGQAVEEMSTISRARKDVRRADSIYLEAAKIDSSVATDALSAAAHLEQERLGEPERARATRARAKAPTPEEATQLAAATEEWVQLEQSSAQKHLREPWLTVIAHLEAAGEALAPAQAGALGYFRAARAAVELHHESLVKVDLKRAASLYEAVAVHCPKSPLAVQSLIAAAEIDRGDLQDVDGARRDLKQAIALGGEKAEDARKALASLPPEPTKPASDAKTTAAMMAALDQAEGDEDDDEAPVPAAHPSEAAPAAPVLDASAGQELKKMKKAALADTALSLSEQAGLKIKRIVVDAGHGGKDDGATGPKGVHEKDVTLGIARMLAATLRARGFEVVMTRSSDEFVALEDRTSIANRERGDLFISVHANASPSRKQTGIETYALNVTSNRFSMRLAARENATAARSVSDLQFLLADLATRANTIDSDRLAEYVETSLVSGVAKKFPRPKALGVKHALFYVLLGAKMPAILVETGFISNPTEEKRLASQKYQSVVAESIAHAVDELVARRHRVASAVP